MTAHNSLRRRLLLGLIILSGCLTLVHTPAYAEPYIAGQLGISVPGSLSDIDVTTAGLPSGVTFSDLDLQNSFLFGAKAGYFSRSVRWFGVEAEIFHTTPHVKQQDVTITGPGGSVTVPGVPGQYFSILTLAPVNLVFRYPGKRFQPYVGVGPGIFFARLKDAQTGDSQSSTSLGLNVQVGLRYFLARHVALFGEYKFNYARLSFEEKPNLDGFDATYSANNFVFGIGYHF
jgi:opacity protein-like surface antigen